MYYVPGVHYLDKFQLGLLIYIKVNCIKQRKFECKYLNIMPINIVSTNPYSNGLSI